MKLTKIIATIGPSSESEEVISELIQQGVNIFRFNFKHNELEWHKSRIQRVQGVAAKLDIPVGILLDLQGPEIRVKIPGDTYEVTKDTPIVLGSPEFTISHPQILPHLVDGQQVVINDGQFTFTLKIEGDQILLIPRQSGQMQPNKSINFPGADYPIDVLTERDIGGIKMAADVGVDFIALSFVRTVEDINYLREQMKAHHLNAKVVSKIEAKRAIDNLEPLIEASDAIMVARGDLGVELPVEQVPYYQKLMIRSSFIRGVPVITATQMLESMMTNSYPTRAEVSDIANAVYDLTDAIMLSGESAMGKYPQEAVSTMTRVASYNEELSFDDVRLTHNFHLTHPEQILCDAAYNLYHAGRSLIAFRGFIVCTHSGKTAHMLSRYRPQVPIFAFTPTAEVARSLTIHFGVYPFVSATKPVNREVHMQSIREMIEVIHERGYINRGDRLIAVHGDQWGVVGGASTVRIVTV